MTVTHGDDRPGFVATEPEHCHGCYRLIRPGQTYYLTIEQAVVCPESRQRGGCDSIGGWPDG